MVNGDVDLSRKKHKFDAERTAAAGFADKRSYVTLDGRQFLALKDMGNRRDYVFRMDEFRCRICKVRVDWFTGELDHFPVSRGRGGDDSIGNLRTLCRECHREQHVRPMWSSQQAVKV